jgi:phosphatidylserine/phosphatidylglycerophosphate/cardiolipin synthase-like enzyme
MRRPKPSLASDSRGAGLVEYLILVGLVGLLALAGMRRFGASAQAKIEGQARCVTELDAGCARAVAAEVPTRSVRVDAAAATTAEAPGQVKLAAAGAGASLLKLASWLNPISRAEAADAPEPPKPVLATAQQDGQRIVNDVVAALRRDFSHGEMGKRYSPLWPRGWVQQRDMWGESWSNQLPGELLQSPPADHWGKRSTELRYPDSCTGTACRDAVEQDFATRRCQSQGDCTRGTCTAVAATAQGGAGPVKLCTGHSDHLYDEIHRTIAGAERSVTISTLAAPDGGYEASMRNALSALHAKQRPGGPGVDVRILIGRADDKDGEGKPLPPGTTIQRILDRLTRDLPAGSPVRVSVGTYGGPDVNAITSFSHAKMIVADSKEAIVGGHNWWTGDYNKENPVHDVSMRVRGPAARHAEAYFDQLWDYTNKHGKVVRNRSSGTPQPLAPLESGTTGEGERVISVGAPGGQPGSATTYAAGDTAILTLMRSAQRTIRLSQQELVSQPLTEMGRDWVRGKAKDNLWRWLQPVGEKLGFSVTDRALEQHIAPAVLDELALAVLRGVKVEIVLTGMDPTSGTKGYSHGWTVAQTRDAVAAHLRTNFPRLSRMQSPRASRGAIEQQLQDNLDIRELRFSNEDTVSVEGTQMPLRNHAKVVIVDDAAAYVGSQNIYPGGMAGRPPFMQLGEFGYVISGAQVSEKLLPTYWEPMWGLAKK